MSRIRIFFPSFHPRFELRPSATWQHCHHHLAPSTLHRLVPSTSPPSPDSLHHHHSCCRLTHSMLPDILTPLPRDTFHSYHHLIERYFSGAHKILDRIRFIRHIPYTITNVSYPQKQHFFMALTISIQASKVSMRRETIQVCIHWILPHSRLNKSTSW